MKAFVISVCLSAAVSTGAVAQTSVQTLDAHIVIDRTIFESAPRFSEAQLGAGSDDTWKRAADQYWDVYR